MQKYGIYVMGICMRKGKNYLLKKIVGLPKIHELDFCEGCVYGKQSKSLFM